MFGFNQWLDAWRMGIDAQQVIALRMARLASGDGNAAVEVIRMVTEKAAAVGEAQIACAMALAGGASLSTAMKRATTPYRKRVRANRRRLGG